MACKVLDKDSQRYMKENPNMKDTVMGVYEDMKTLSRNYFGTTSMVHNTITSNIPMFWHQKLTNNPIAQRAWKMASNLYDKVNMLSRQDMHGISLDNDLRNVASLTGEDIGSYNSVCVGIEKNIFDLDSKTGEEVTAQINKALNGKTDAVKQAYASSRKLFDIRFLDIFQTMINTDNTKVNDRVRYSDEQKRKLSALDEKYGDYLTKRGNKFVPNTPEEIKKAYNAERSQIESETQAILNADYQRVYNGGRVEDSPLIDLYRELGYRSGYIPHKRNGKYFAIVRDKDGKMLHREHFDAFLYTDKSDTVLNRLAERFGVDKSTIETGVNIDYEPTVQDIRAIKTVLDNPAIRSKVNIDDATMNTLIRELAEMSKQGFGKQFRRRASDSYITGFDTEIHQTVKDYMYNSGASLAKVMYRQEQVDIVADMKVGENVSADQAKYYKRYLEEQFRQSTKGDLAVQKSASLFYYINFSLRPAYGFMNLAGHYVNLSSQRLHSKSSILDGQKVIFDILGSYGKQTGNEKFRDAVEGFKDHKYAKEIRYVLDKAMATSRLDEHFLDDFDVKNKNMNAVEKFVSWIPVKSEKLTRMSAFVTGAIDGMKKNPNMTMEELYDYAMELDNMVNYAKGRANRSNFEMGGGVAASLARMGTIYTSYARNQIAMLGYMMKDKNYAGLGVFSAMTLVLGGAMASPATGSIIKLMEQLFGKDWEDEFKASDNVLAQIIGGGIAYPFGADFSGQMTASLPFLTEPYMLSVFKNSHMADYAHKGDYIRAFESGFLTPVQVKNVLKAIRLHDEGDKTTNGRLIIDENGEPIKVDNYGAMLYSVFGIRPADYSKAKSRQYLSQKMTQLYADKKREVRARYLYAEDGDSSEIDALNLEIGVVNEGLGLDISLTDTDIDDTYSINMADVDDSYLWRIAWFGE